MLIFYISACTNVFMVQLDKFLQYLQVPFSMLSFYLQASACKEFSQCLREPMLCILMWKARSRSVSALLRIFKLHRFLREVNVFQASQPPLNKVYHVLINSLEIAFNSLCSAILFAKNIIYFFQWLCLQIDQINENYINQNLINVILIATALVINNIHWSPEKMQTC